METTELKGNGQIRAGRIEIDVPYRDGKSTFVLPMHGPDYHSKVMGKIDSQKLLRPTTSQVLSLVDLAMQNPSEAHCKEILNRFTNNYLWSGTESMSFPEGVIVYDNVDAEMPKNTLVLRKMIKEGDRRARFVEPGFQTGDMPIEDFLSNPYTIAQVGEEMIPVVRRVAERLRLSNAYVSGLDSSNQDVKRFTAVSGYGGRLDLDGNYDDNCRNGHASGVLDTAEGSAPKNLGKE
jgi:hypothetical protein